MKEISRKKFMGQVGVIGASLVLLNSCGLSGAPAEGIVGVVVDTPTGAEDIFSYINRVNGKYDRVLYMQIVGATNEFKEGDMALGVAATSDKSRANARLLLSNTHVADINNHTLHRDSVSDLIAKTTLSNNEVASWTIGKLKEFILSQPEEKIKEIMPALSSDVIGCVVKLMSNDELIMVGQKVFNPLPGSKIGSKGYMGARIQPNSPTDNIDDITWQVFDAWSYAVGDLVLGTNPVSSEPASVAAIEKALFDIITTFRLENTIPNCVLSHIDVQAAVEEIQPGTTGIWFQSLAGTESANTTFDLTVDKMQGYAGQRNGRYGLYAETGQGADFTNGHAEGVDMVILESRKYGFLRALKLQMTASKPADKIPWTHVNDVAGFIGPEVFKSKEQLVRCCLEDTVMGKLHGLTIGLDICSTLHMDVTLDDLDWCIEQVMPANPAYLMALPTKNDPMLSYLTTAFSDHVRIREKFGYKVNDAIWDFFKQLEVIDSNGKPTKHFGDPIWVYYQYRKAKGDTRTKEAVYAEGRQKIKEIRGRGVPIAEGYGNNHWDMNPELEKEIRVLYEDAKVSLWTEMPGNFVKSIPAAIPVVSTAADRKDHVYHPQAGEQLSADAISKLNELNKEWKNQSPEVQIIISDGLNARAIMDEGHLQPFLTGIRDELVQKGYTINDKNIVITYGRVRTGYQCGEVLFGSTQGKKGIVHIIGERPGSGHHNFSAYLTVAPTNIWAKKGTVDHNISRVVSGISDTAMKPELAAIETAAILDRMFGRVV
jgi:ethanolamine ammonia-lyase large subunit